MGKKRYLLVVDVGTGSGRSIIFNEGGEQVSVTQREWSHPIDPQYDNAVDFECVQNWKLICECTRNSISKANIHSNEIVAVTATSMRHGIVCYDGKGSEIFAVPNVDARANSETALLIQEGWGPKIYEIQGDWPNIHALARIRWLKKNKPDIFNRISMMSILSDWVVYRLSGEYATEPSIASSSGMFDIKTRRWSETLISLAGLSRHNVPRVTDPGKQVGEVTSGSAKETGLSPKTPVMIGMGDTQSGYIGSGIISPGDAGIVAGSFWLPSVISSEPLIDLSKRIRTNCHAIENLWILESCSFYTGLAIRWFRDAFCQEETLKARKLGKDPYELMDEMAQRVAPGSHGMQVILSNIGNNSHWIHASPAFLNFDVLDPRSYNKATFYRALLENTSYQSLGEFNNIVEVCGSWPKEIVFSGGGSKSPLLAQILADTLDIPVKVPLVHESTALGAAIMCACGIGIYDSVAAACKKAVHFQRCFEPDKKLNEIYRESYRYWRAIYPSMLHLVDEKLTTPMWKAPGT